MRTHGITAASALLATLLIGCSANEPSGFGGSDYDYGADVSDGGSDGGTDTSFEPGFEDEAFDLTTPTASANFVWIANTTRGTLAKVAVTDGAIRISTVRVGAEPTVIVTDPNDDLALVLNRGSATVSVVRAGVAGEDDTVQTVDVVENANRLSLSPDAAVAFAWYDNRAAELGDAPGSLTELSAIMTADGDGRVFQISVGLNVREVRYSSDGSEAFILSDDGVSRLRLDTLDGDRFVPPIAIAEPGEDIPLSEGREILVADAVDLALVRIGDRSALRLVDLVGGDVRDLDLPEPPTDIDLVPGSSFAILSMRDREEIGILDMDAFRDGELAPIDWLELEGQPAGQTVLSPAGDDLLVFSAAADSERLSIVDLVTSEVRTLNLRKGVRGAVISPDGRSAIVYHSKEPGEPIAGEPEEDIIAKSHAFSAIAIDTGITKLVRTDAQPGEMTFDLDGGNAFILAADEATGTRALEWVDLRTFRSTHFEFDRTPEHVGVVPGAGLIYVSQIHDLGRIAFIDVATGEVREITGFELNGLID